VKSLGLLENDDFIETSHFSVSNHGTY
jgi:hypothetical protein